MAMKENSKSVLLYLKSVNGYGIFTSAIQRKGLGVRVPAEIELGDGTHRAVKFLRLTDAGMEFDPDATEE